MKSDTSNYATLDILVGFWSTTIKMLGSDDDDAVFLQERSRTRPR